MKLKYIATVAFFAAALSLQSCVKDLDVTPLDKNVISADKAYSDAESYTKGLNKIYSVWALSGQDGAGSSDVSGLDPGNTVLFRSWWTLQENTSDATKCSWADTWVSAVNSITWNTAQVESIEGVYQRCMYIVALTNEFMKNVGNAPSSINQAEYGAEARFNRALAYYTLMDMFALPPFITESNYSINPSPLTRTELFNWIESELLEIVDALPTKTAQYGRADKGAANALLARMYLNAEVYTGVDRYSDCVAACNSIISSNSYALADDYAALFMADNGENVNAAQEIIFPVIFDGILTQSYGMGAIMLGSRGSSVGTVDSYGCEGGWDGFRSTGNLVRSFEFESSNESNWNSDNIKDKRGIFYSDGKSLDITSSAIGTFTTEGWSVYKYTNKNSDGSNGQNKAFPDTDFPMFRLADVYLMYAEAVARGGSGGDISTAVGYVNALRKRGYGDDSGAIDSSWLSATASIAGSDTKVAFGNILNERARELYWEGTRRTDLIRYDLFTSSSYVWAEKGGVIGGVGVDSRYNVFPIPQTDMGVNSNLQQNPGY
ncbi:MAG: RagB/SusD family nutrient uptake outer membrane protein [Rikenellaceae bacterium]